MALEVPTRVVVFMDASQCHVADTIALTLNHGVYLARVVTSVPEAVAQLMEWRPHMAVIDMDLGDGALLRQLGIANEASGGTTVPVIGLTRRGDLKTKLAAFDQGVDDVMTVPFSPEELLARALVLTRRVYGATPPLNPTIRIGEIEIDILNRMLYLLAANAGKVVSRDEILDALWGVDFVSESNIVDRHVRALRIKLQNDWRHPRFIATVPGKGYRFVPTFTDTPTRDA